MSKQQTALQTLIKWGDKMLKENPNKILSFSEVIDKAEELLQMEREQHENTWIDSRMNDKGDSYIGKQISFEKYYNQTYGTEPSH